MIDPVLDYSTLIAGSGGSFGTTSFAIAVDSSGNIYITGYTGSTTFPGTSQTNAASYDGFVSKFNSSGTLQWSTLIGVNEGTISWGMALDSSANIYITGYTGSTTFAGTSQTNAAGNEVAFVSKLNSAGALQWSTLIGGGQPDYGYGIAVDSFGDIYITGNTGSITFPGTSQSVTSGSDAFVSKLSDQVTPTVTVGLTGTGVTQNSNGSYSLTYGTDYSINANVTGTGGVSLGTPTLTYYAGTYTLDTLPSSGGSSHSPSDAGNYTVVASYTGNTDYSSASSIATYSIGQATPLVPTPTVPANAVYNAQPQGATVGDATGVNNTDLGAPMSTYYAGTYTLANLPSSGGSSTAPTDAGNYTVVASYAGSPDYKAASALATFTIAKASTSLSNPAVEQITLGASTTTVSGQLTSNTLVPVGQSVAITLNSMTQSVTVGADGTFSTSFATGALGAGTYTISYGYAGDNNFTAASSTGSLAVAYGSQLLFDNTKPVYSGAVLPIKLSLTDASGANLSSPNIAVTATSLVDASGNAVTLEAEGNSNPNNLFRYAASLGGYIFNLDTKGLAAGTYTLYYIVGNDPTKYSLTFVVD